MTSKPETEDEMTTERALDVLEQIPGSRILYEEDAREIAATFDVELHERPGEIEPLCQLDRLQPDDDTLGIGVGTLIYKLALGIEDVEAQDNNAPGRSRNAWMRKEDNLPALKNHAEV